MKQVTDLVMPINLAATGSTMAERISFFPLPNGDITRHYSKEFYCEDLVNKYVKVTARPQLGPLAPLWVWIEISPFPSQNSNIWPQPLPTWAYDWSAIGGGGGVSAGTVTEFEPLNPNIITQISPGDHTISIEWTIHSSWARVVCQVPSWAGFVPASSWDITAYFSGKGW